MLLPLAVRLNHRPCFLAFVYIAIASMLKSYPSVGDLALYMGLLGLFINELADMQLSFFLFCGYVGVSLLSPVMHNLWIWRGTGNANFYFATAMAYACLQIILVVESVGAMLNHDRKLRKLSATTAWDCGSARIYLCSRGELLAYQLFYHYMSHAAKMMCYNRKIVNSSPSKYGTGDSSRFSWIFFWVDKYWFHGPSSFRGFAVSHFSLAR